MSADVQATNFKNSVLTSIIGTAEDAYQRMQAKKAEYEAAMKSLDLFAQVKNKAYTKFKTVQSNKKNGNDSTLLSAKYEYTIALGSYSDADRNTDILRSNLQDSIFYSGKMNNSASIANAALG